MHSTIYIDPSEMMFICRVSHSFTISSAAIRCKQEELLALRTAQTTMEAQSEALERSLDENRSIRLLNMDEYGASREYVWKRYNGVSCCSICDVHAAAVLIHQLLVGLSICYCLFNLVGWLVGCFFLCFFVCVFSVCLVVWFLRVCDCTLTTNYLCRQCWRLSDNFATLLELTRNNG